MSNLDNDCALVDSTCWGIARQIQLDEGSKSLIPKVCVADSPLSTNDIRQRRLKIVRKLCLCFIHATNRHCIWDLVRDMISVDTDTWENYGISQQVNVRPITMSSILQWNNRTTRMLWDGDCSCVFYVYPPYTVFLVLKRTTAIMKGTRWNSH